VASLKQKVEAKEGDESKAVMRIGKKKAGGSAAGRSQLQTR
jgi:hypothetical protein